MTDDLRAKCSCSSCGTHLEFSLESAGAVIACPHCGISTELTLEAPPSSTTPDGVSPQDILSAFTGAIPRKSVPFVYRVALCFVALFIVMLPIIYMALVAAAAAGVWFYATHFFFLLQSFRGGYVFFMAKALAYVGPLFAGGVLVLFMVKPLFAKRIRRPDPVDLNPALEPTLFTFISKICELTGAPMPTRIAVDCELNASAGFARGSRSLLSGDLMLVIGLPLVAGLSAREFAGIVAHEFGHFTQGSAMRISYIVRQINCWFARLVYERDEWDAWLEENGMESDDWRVLIVFNCARLALGLSRLILKLFLFTAHGMSCFLMRQMEFDADSYEFRLVGSETFESATRKLAVLLEGERAAYKEMRTTWNLSRALPLNLPDYVVAHAGKVPPHVSQRVQDTLGLAKTRVFDTHPCDADRIRCARKAQELGVFHLDVPATALFTRFPDVAREVTELHYSENLGLNLMAAKLRPA